MCTRFIFRKNARAPDRPGAIVCRVTVDGDYKPFTTSVHCLKAEWDAQAQRLKGRSQTVRLANAVLTGIGDELNRHYATFQTAGAHVTAERLLRAYRAGTRPKVPLLSAWAEFIALRRPLVGTDLSAASLAIDEVRGEHLRAFLRARHQLDLLPGEFTGKWADALLTYLRIDKRLSQNYAAKVLQSVKQVLRFCVRHEYAQADPLAGYGLRFAPPKPPVFLVAPELLRLRTHVFASPVLRRAADCFLFQCYTGLAYVDLARFRRTQHTALGPDGRPWLMMDRQKTQHSTGQVATVRLLPVPLGLLATYGEALPVPTNQVYNRYLKEIAAVLGLSAERLTSHVGRKTAGAMLLRDGMSLTAVSKILGHATVAITQRHYVSITDDLVSSEMVRVYDRERVA